MKRSYCVCCRGRTDTCDTTEVAGPGHAEAQVGPALAGDGAASRLT